MLINVLVCPCRALQLVLCIIAGVSVCLLVFRQICTLNEDLNVKLPLFYDRKDREDKPLTEGDWQNYRENIRAKKK